MEWMSDGALYGHEHEATFGKRGADGAHDMKGAAKDVLILAASSSVVAGGLSALAAYRHKKDPKVGMPELGPFGLDTIVGVIGLGAAIIAGPKLGETGELLALGAGLGGINCAAVFYGGAMGASMASPKSVSGTGVGKVRQMPEHTRMSAKAAETLRGYGVQVPKAA